MLGALLLIFLAFTSVRSEEEFTCWGISHLNTSFVCSGNGVCVKEDSCDCNFNFTGDECEIVPFARGTPNVELMLPILGFFCGGICLTMLLICVVDVLVLTKKRKRKPDDVQVEKELESTSAEESSEASDKPAENDENFVPVDIVQKYADVPEHMKEEYTKKDAPEGWKEKYDYKKSTLDTASDSATEGTTETATETETETESETQTETESSTASESESETSETSGFSDTDSPAENFFCLDTACNSDPFEKEDELVRHINKNHPDLEHMLTKRQLKLLTEIKKEGK